jgi:hypothetical protein
LNGEHDERFNPGDAAVFRQIVRHRQTLVKRVETIRTNRVPAAPNGSRINHINRP